MAVGSLGQLTVDLVANTAGFERGMNQAERALASATKEAKYQGDQLQKLVGQIDPVTGALNRLDAQQQKLDEHWKAGRLPTDDYKKFSDILNAQKTAATSATSAFGQMNRAMAANGQTLKQYNNNLRGIPAQFTDIVTSLQGGQKPLTVLLQQGGQLKDMFGGIGPAAKALGGYVAGLVNPFTVAAAAAAVLALAYKQGSDEATAFSTALITSGNAAGTNADQLATSAQSVSKSVGTVGAAAAVLTQLAASGKIPASQFDTIAIAALKMQEATGKAADETVKEFEKLADDPVKASKELNDSLNYLTASEYAQIAALQARGDAQGAATLAENAYASALTERADKIVSNLGYVEKGWNSVKNAAKEAWDAFVDIQRPDTVEQKLKTLQDRLQSIADADAINQTKGSGGAIAPQDYYRQEDAEKQIRDLLIEQNEVRNRLAAQQIAAGKEKAGIAAVEAINKGLVDSEDKATKLAKALALIDKQVKAAAATGVNYTDAQIKQLKDKAIADNTDPVKKTPAVRDDAGQKMLQTLREQGAALQAQDYSLDTQTGKYQALGAQAQALAKFNQQIADIKSKDIQTADDKALLASQDLITAQLKKNVALEQEVAARKQSYEEAQKLQAFQDNQSSKLSTAQDNLNSNLEGIGLGTKGRERLKEDLAIRKDYANQQDQLEKQHNTGAISDDLYKKESDSLQDALGERLVMQQDYYNQVDKLNSDAFAGMSEAWANYAAEATNYQQQAAEATSSILNSVTSSVADNIESLIKGQESIGDFFKNVATDMANAVIGALVKMAAQWLVYQAVQILTGKTTQAAAATTLIANAEAMSLQAGIAAFASTAAIPIVGPFAAPAALGAALAITQPLVAGVSAAALSGMAHDGIDSIPETGTWLLQKGERVTTASTSAKLDKTLDNVANGTTRNSGSTTVNLIEDASKAGQSQTREQDGEKYIDMWISNLYSDDRVMDALTKKTGLKPVGR